jgi:hypothetical protein
MKVQACQVLHAAMMAAADRLRDALQRETQFRRTDLAHATSDTQERWKLCRHDVESLAAEHTAAVAAWREALIESCGKSADFRWED